MTTRLSSWTSRRDLRLPCLSRTLPGASHLLPRCDTFGMDMRAIGRSISRSFTSLHPRLDCIFHILSSTRTLMAAFLSALRYILSCITSPEASTSPMIYNCMYDNVYYYFFGSTRAISVPVRVLDPSPGLRGRRDSVVRNLIADLNLTISYHSRMICTTAPFYVGSLG